jgi:tetratricopeptide (TPR) repeat protein
MTLDAFAQAGSRLANQRPLKDRQLQQIAALLQPQQPPALAQVALDSYLRDHPRDADALNLKARNCLRQGRTDEAIVSLQGCLEAAPDFAIARYNLANLLFKQYRTDEALAQVEQLLAGDAQNPLYREMKAVMLEAGVDLPQSVELYRALASEHPQRAQSWLQLGHALRALGEREECVTAYRQAIACRPGLGAAWWGLANLRTLAFGPDDIAAMRKQLARNDLAPADRTGLLYALGKACEDERRDEEAFAHYAEAQATLRQRIKYEPEVLTRAVARQKAVFTPAFFEARRGAGCTRPGAIFILGRPRSGSTLVEQILASHPAIEGTAELPYIGAIASELAIKLTGRPDAAFGVEHLKALEQLPPPRLAELGELYLQRASPHRRLGRPFFIDKMPANFFHAGLIALILPQARILDVRRHPVACCLSIFKSHSSKGILGLAELGLLHRDYVDLMAHFDRVLPGRIHRVTYETLVAEPEAQVRRLLDALGLPFDEACLRFHETKRAVLTPSSEQVRQPVFTSAVDHWRRFEPWLAPLIESLGAVHTDYPAVPAEFTSGCGDPVP